MSRAPIDEGSVIRIGDWVGVVLRLTGEPDGAVFQEIIPGYFAGPKTLAAMSPFERKIVHDAVAAAGQRSESEGEEPGRRVVVYPAQ